MMMMKLNTLTWQIINTQTKIKYTDMTDYKYIDLFFYFPGTKSDVLLGC